MKILMHLLILLTCIPSIAAAQNFMRPQNEADSLMNPKVACQNQKFGFNPQEIETCVQVYQSCMRSDLRQNERHSCIIDAVRKGKVSQAGQSGSVKSNAPPPARGGNLDFSFTAFQAYDLIEICEQKQNKNRTLCSGAILPNKAKIMSDINTARRQ